MRRPGRRLFWHIYITLLASLALVAVLGAVIWKLTGDPASPRLRDLGARVAGALLPPADAPVEVQQAAIERLAAAVRGRVTLTDAQGRQLVAGDSVERDERHHWMMPLADGRRIGAQLEGPPWSGVFTGFRFIALVALGVGLAALPVVRMLTRRLESLRAGVELWGSGRINHRVEEKGRDEVAAVAVAFNRAAARIEGLIGAHKTMLAHASHELRSPLARLRMAIETRNTAEIERNFAELDGLIEEILLASRLDQAADALRRENVDVLALAAEEAAAYGSESGGDAAIVAGDPVLLRRALRNLIDNAARHGRAPVDVVVSVQDARVAVEVRDRGTGIAEAERERVFEPFYRPRGVAEASGSWGLGLPLVRQIVARHGGEVRCLPREGGGTVFRITLPRA
ncbi:MAG: HAMP domain-containing histidine kinase [Alphaproteobacteria bacterium]|nr:HAMP domain-containing histidine kinase [Alphaproteobacteria bacterium]